MRVPRVVAVVAIGAAMVAVPGRSDAAVSLSAARTEMLYSSESEVDCSQLFAIADDAALPRNVTRIHATVTGASDPSQVRIRWFVPEPEAGQLVANLDLGPQDETPAVTGMCADFGNACVLTEDRLKFYRETSVLWVAPTCRDLPKNTAKPFRGQTIRVRAKAFEGKRKLGRATITLGYGREGSVTLYVSDGRVRSQGILRQLVVDDGIGKSRVGVPITPVFGAVPTLPADPPGQIMDYVFDNGGGGTATVDPGCAVATTVPLAACQRVDYSADGRFFATVAARFPDKSALCDAVDTSVNNCNGDIAIDVRPRPLLAVYDPAKPDRSTVDVQVRVKNVSRPKGDLPACNVLFEGADVLTCSEEFRAGGIKDMRTTRFGLQHCSLTQGRGCDVDQDCRVPVCEECQPNEVCLTQSHCSQTFTRTCSSDADCDNAGSPAPCPDCKDGETCLRLLAFGSSIGLRPGESATLLQSHVELRNEFGTLAHMKDTWTAVESINHFTDEQVIRYDIKPRER